MRLDIILQFSNIFWALPLFCFENMNMGVAAQMLKAILIACSSCPYHRLGKPVPTIIDDFLEKFQRGEGGSFPIQKISLQNF